MKHTLIQTLVLSLLLMLALPGRAQGRFFLTGEVRDRATNMYLPEAQCKIFDENGVAIDSVRADGYKETGTGYIRLSNFSLQVPKKEGVYRMEFIFPDFDTTRIDYELRGIGGREDRRRIGAIYMSRHQEHTLNEVTVTATKVKFYYKGDTIVYNADAFNLSEGSMLDALVGALPGVQIKENGQIFVNGRYVESLLLDGKEFFQGNNQLMLNNLGAYTVKDIRVYEKQTKMAEFVGNDFADGKQYVMDVKLKQEFQSGTILNIEVGGGTSDRYLGRLFAMHYKGDNRFTFVGNANNLAMTSRASRHSSYFTGTEPTQGEKRICDGGFDYNVAIGKAQLEGDVYVTGSKSILNSTSFVTNYQQNAETYSYARSHSVNKELLINTRHKLTNSSKHHIYVLQAKYDFQKTDASTNAASMLTSYPLVTDRWMGLLDRINQGDMSMEVRDSLINQSIVLGSDKLYKSNYRLSGAGSITFDKMPDWISWRLSVGYNNFHSQNLTERLINYGDPEFKGIGERQRQSNRPNSAVNVDASLAYNYKIKSYMLLTLGYGFNVEHKEQTSNLFTASILADATGRFDLLALRNMQETLMASNSFVSRGNDYRHSLNASFACYPSRSLQILSTVPLSYISQHIDYRRGDVHATPTRHSVGIDGAPVYVKWIVKNDYENQTNDYIDFRYNVATRTPDLVSTIDIVDDIDPLNVFLGNPGLKNSWQHSFNASYIINTRKNQSIQLIAEFNTTANALVSGYWLDPVSGKRFFKTYNVDGNLDSRLYLDYWKRLSSKFEYRGILIEKYYRYSGMYGEGSQPVAEQKSHALHSSLQQTLKFKSGGSMVDLTLYGLWRRENTPNRGIFDMGEVSAYLGTTFSLPLGFEFENVFNLTKRMGYADKSLNKFYPLWNASLTYRFGGGKWLLGIHAYDILNKMDNVVSTMDANGRTETYYNYIPRYVLATLQFKFNHSRAKSAPQIIY